MGFIYKVTNSVNGKVYIGQTMRTIPVRWSEHLRDSGMMPTQKSCSKHISILHQAIKKYGVEAFTIEQVEECDNKDLNDRERYWIEYYHSWDGGYNIYRSSNKYAKYSNEDLIELWNKGYLLKEIINIIDMSEYNLSKRLQYIGITKEEIIKRGNMSQSKKLMIPVYQYDIDGNFIKEFPSLKEAQESIGNHRIKFPPKLKGVSVCGYQWRKFKADKIESVRNICKPRKKFLEKTA